MKDKIEKLIVEHKILKQEVWHQLEELNSTDANKLPQIEKDAFEHCKNYYETEYSVRLSFITDLENLITNEI
jgi:hypothetical protein